MGRAYEKIRGGTSPYVVAQHPCPSFTFAVGQLNENFLEIASCTPTIASSTPSLLSYIINTFVRKS